MSVPAWHGSEEIMDQRIKFKMGKGHVLTPYAVVIGNEKFLHQTTMNDEEERKKKLPTTLYKTKIIYGELIENPLV